MTVPFDVTDADTAKHYILYLTETVTARIRADGALVRVVAVSITDNDFNRASHQMTLSSPTDITGRIYEASCRLFDELWAGAPIRQLGIHTSGVSHEAYYQYDLFEGTKIDKLRAADSMADRIRSYYGHDSLKRACFLKN